jgi:hypothetical protein
MDDSQSCFSPPSSSVNQDEPISNPMSATSSDPGPLADDHKPSYTTSYVSFTSPPTPSPSPSPQLSTSHYADGLELALLRDIRPQFTSFSVHAKNALLSELLSTCPVETLVHVYNIITPRIKRDFLRDLPPEIALHVVSFIDDARTLTRASAVSKYWRTLLFDECLWKNMCKVHKYCSHRISVSGSRVTGNGGVCCSPRARVVRRLSIANIEAEDEVHESARGAIGSLSLSDSEAASTEDMDVDYTDERAVLEAEAIEQAGMSFPLPQRRTLGRTRNAALGTRALGSNLPPRLAADSGSASRKRAKQSVIAPALAPFSYKQHFKISFLTGSSRRSHVPLPSLLRAFHISRVKLEACGPDCSFSHLFQRNSNECVDRQRVDHRVAYKL